MGSPCQTPREGKRRLFSQLRSLGRPLASLLLADQAGRGGQVEQMGGSGNGGLHLAQAQGLEALL